MTDWIYASGYLEARSEDGALLLAIPDEPMWAPLADRFNVKPAAQPAVAGRIRRW